VTHMVWRRLAPVLATCGLLIAGCGATSAGGHPTTSPTAPGGGPATVLVLGAARTLNNRALATTRSVIVNR
jgi:hypothetical protein